METSAMNGAGIDDLFNKIIDLLLKRGASQAQKNHVEGKLTAANNAGLNKISGKKKDCC